MPENVIISSKFKKKLALATQIFIFYLTTM